MIHLYLGSKRFNGENKAANLTNFYAEMNYALDLIITTKDIVDFIFQLLLKSNSEELDREIRLYLHTYFHCEFTMILSVNFPHSIDENTILKGQTSHSISFEVPLSKMGQHIKSVIKDKHLVQIDAKRDAHKMHDLTKIVPTIINKPIFNYTAYPVVIENVCTHLVVLCNRKKEDSSGFSEVEKSHLSFDEHKLVNFVLHNLQSVLSRIKKVESENKGEAKLRTFVKLIKEI